MSRATSPDEAQKREVVRQSLRRALDRLIGVRTQMQAEGQLSPIMTILSGTLEYTIGGLRFADDQLRTYSSADDFTQDFNDELRVVETTLAQMEEPS